MISKGKFRYLRELYGYSIFRIWEDTRSGRRTGYYRGKVFHNMHMAAVPGLSFDATGVDVTLSYKFEV